MIETNRFFSVLQKEGVNQIMMRHKTWTQSNRKYKKTGVITAEPPQGDNSVSLLSTFHAGNPGSNPSGGLTQVTPMREEEITNCKVI